MKIDVIIWKLNFLPNFYKKIEYYYVIVKIVFLLAETPWRAIKASQNP